MAKRKNRHRPLRCMSRMWSILRLLSDARVGMRAHEIAEYLDVPVRSVYRDLERLQEAGYSLYTKMDGRFSRWLLLTPLPVENLPLSVDDIRVLKLAETAMIRTGYEWAAPALSRLTHRLQSTMYWSEDGETLDRDSELMENFEEIPNPYGHLADSRWEWFSMLAKSNEENVFVKGRYHTQNGDVIDFPPSKSLTVDLNDGQPLVTLEEVATKKRHHVLLDGVTSLQYANVR